MANWKDYANRVMTGAGRLAADVRQRNRHTARMNRLRTVLRCQERAAEREYMALGRYYYNALRDKENALAEEHCQRLDKIQAVLDSTLSSLEAAAREEAASVGVISSEDGPVAVYIKDKQAGTVRIHNNNNDDDGTLFHFSGGPLEITVTRDVVYHPEDEDVEEIDLSDVESFDHDPMPEDASPTDPGLGAPAELDENDSLPFEG